METNTRKVPGFDGGDHTSGLFGGFIGTWLAENATATEVDPKFRQIVLNAKKLACYTKASNEVIADGMNFEQTLGTALTQCIAWYLDYSFLQGLGAGQPLGLLHDPALIVVPKATGQARCSICYENLCQMYARLHPSCLNSRSCVWIANSTTVPQLMSVSITAGTAGVHYPVLKEDAGRFYIFGKQVLLTEKLLALGSQGDLVLADLAQYAIGLRKEVSLERSNAPGWLQDQTAYRAIVRCDGMGTWGKAVTPKNGDTLSWVVTLAERA
jgi:HK97 family phage major capsid protein